MNHKVTLRSVFVLAVALGLAAVMLRVKDEPAVRRAAPPTVQTDSQTRPLASYRVNEEKIEGGSDYLGANYRARVSEAGFTFGQVPEAGSRFAARQFSVTFGAPRIEQGKLRLECDKGTYKRAAFGVAQIDRGVVTEEYVFENRRVEQIFRFPAPVAEGALKVCIPVTSDLTGPVVTHSATEPAFKELQFLKGGIAFCDAEGATRLAYHTAVAIDAEGRQIALAPRHENKEIILEVPAQFMAVAAYPVTVDPWVELGGSGSGGGISNNGSVSDRPQLRVTGGGLTFICWADNSAADSANPDNYDIYLKYWNGFKFSDLSSSSSAGGISNNIGKSTNPSLALEGGNGDPLVAWQDETGGAVHIQLRKWDGVNGGPWIAFGRSATPFGVSGSFGPSLNPSVDYLFVRMRGDGINVPDKFDLTPVVAWEEAPNTSEIYCAFFYPGSPATSPPVPSGWYFLSFDGVGIDPLLRYPNGPVSVGTISGVSQRPQLAVDFDNRIHVVWQDTNNGNFEIYSRTWGTGAAFEVLGSAGGGSDIQPPTGWLETTAGSASGGGISGTASTSTVPSLAVDVVGPPFQAGITVAWQETLPVAPPATSTQVYLRRSLNYGAFGAISGSAAGLGISQSTASASNPSVDVNGGYISVAWADTSNVNPEIYVRRSALPGGPWEQVGFQGSASPLLGADTVAPIDGISKTGSLSLTPSVRNDIFGNPTVVWADGTLGTFDILMRQFAPNGPGVAAGTTFTTNLRQTITDPTLGPAVDITVPGTSSSTTVFLSATMFTEALTPAGTALRLEVEVKPSGGAFTGTPTATSLSVAPGSTAVVPFAGLPNFNYHWQARSIDQFGRVSPWVAFGVVGGVSFQINTGGGGGGGPVPPPIVVSTRGKGSCGLTGLECVLLLGVAALIRRRRSK